MVLAADDLSVLPPHDLEAEDALIGGTLLLSGDPGWLVTVERALAIATPDDFYSGANQTLWRLIASLHSRNAPPDAVLIQSEATRRGILRDIGGPDRIATLSATASSPAHIEHFAEIVRGHANRRRIIYACTQAAHEARVGADPSDAVARLTALSASSLSRALPWVTGEEVVTAPDEVEPWAVEGFARPGVITLFGADAGAGKSTFLAAIAAAALAGHSVIDLHCPPAPAVLWVSEESRTTLRELLGPSGLSTPNLHILPREATAGLPWPAIIAAAHDHARRTKASLIFLDTFAGLAGLDGEQENQAGPVGAALRPVRTLAASGPAVILTHHLSKDAEKKRRGVARFRGSTALVGEVDACITMDREGGDDSPLRRLTAVKARGQGWVRGVTYEFVPEGPSGMCIYRLERRGSRGSVVAATKGQDILATIQANPWQSTAEYARACGGKKADLLAALHELVARGVLTTREGPRGATLYGPRDASS
jgi:hypothetical protein